MEQTKKLSSMIQLNFGIASLGAYVGSAWGDSVIDDVAYFDRALTDTEITDHYNGNDGLGGGLDLTSKYW